MSDSALPRPDRRRLLAGAAVLGVTAPILAACGSGDEPTGSSGSPQESPADSGSPTEPGGGGGGAQGDAALVTTAEVPAGGGVVLDDRKVVVTQPAEGEFKAFSAICTHQGCLVGSVEDNNITCPCHGSQFSAEDGSVVTGPATAALAEVAVRVEAGNVVEL